MPERWIYCILNPLRFQEEWASNQPVVMFHKEFRQKLVTFFSQKLRVAEREKSGRLNSLYRILGLHHCVQKNRTLEYRQILHALNGIPKEEAWHEFRIRKLFNTRDTDLDEWSRQMWLIDDIELFLRRYPKNETVRFLLAELKMTRVNVEAGIEVLDRIIEMNGKYLVEAYRRRAEFLRKIDPAAANQDLEKTAEWMKKEKQSPSSWEFNVPDAQSYDFEILPDQPEISLNKVRDLIKSSDPEKMLEMIPNVRCSNLRQELYCAAASRYFERNDRIRAKELLNMAVEMICCEKQSKSEIGHAIAEVAHTRGKLFGKDEGKELLDTALKVNSLARSNDAKESTLGKIIDVQIEFSFFEEAEKWIRIRAKNRPCGGLLKLADALTASGEKAKADALRQEVDEYWSAIDDRDVLTSLLFLAESYTKAGEREKARDTLRKAMNLAKYETYDFGLLMQIICDGYIDCDFLGEFKTDVSQYAGREGVKWNLERIDEVIRNRQTRYTQ